STLYGAAGCANNPALTRLLLERGAIPNDDTLYLAAFFDDHQCLQLLLSHVQNIGESQALAAPISTGNVEGVRILLEAGVDPGRPVDSDLLGERRGKEAPISPVAAAIEFLCRAELIELLLRYGGDPNAPGRDGRSPVQMAARQGRTEVVEMLKQSGARDDRTETDDFLSACMQADRTGAKELLSRSPELLSRLTDEDHGALVTAAGTGNVEAVRLMLAFGFPVNVRAGDDGGTALHAATVCGAVDIVRLLIEAGADLEARDATWDSSPLVWATVGSGLPRNDPAVSHYAHPDFVATVRLLLESGAVTEDVTVGQKPPNAEVAELLRTYGIGASEGEPR
ncbi:MAG: ankyrin repeat domain-containing protein, partial [Chloroflexota bacterium]